MDAKDLLLSDAIETAIESEKKRHKAEKMMRIFMAIDVIIAVALALVVLGGY